MNSTADPPDPDAEAARVGRVYERYRRSRRRRRAWAAGNPGNQAIREELLAAVLDEAGPQLRSGGEVLDVGCGTGYWLEALHDAGVDPASLTGVEVLPERVATAAERVPAATVLRADARALPFDDCRFAVVLMFTVLSSLGSVQDVRRAVREAGRVLAADGLVLLYEPRLPNPLNRDTRFIRHDEVALEVRQRRSITLLPPVARRLGPQTEMLYPRLARIRALRSHQLTVYGKTRTSARSDSLPA